MDQQTTTSAAAPTQPDKPRTVQEHIALAEAALKVRNFLKGDIQEHKRAALAQLRNQPKTAATRRLIARVERIKL